MTPTKKLPAAIFVVAHTDSTYLAIPSKFFAFQKLQQENKLELRPKKLL
jgi:hypothetical protein